MESETSEVIGGESAELAVNGAGLCEPIVTHDVAATASGEPTVEGVSPPEENCTSSDAGTTYYTLVVQAGSYGSESTGVTSEPITVPVLVSSDYVNNVTSCNFERDDSQQTFLLMPTADGDENEGGIWITQPSTSSGGVDLSRSTLLVNDIVSEDMGSDVVSVVSPETGDLILKHCSDSRNDLRMRFNKIKYKINDHDDDEVHIEVVDDISERPDSIVTIDSEISSTSYSSDAYYRKTDSQSSIESENDYHARKETRTDSKMASNRTSIETCPLIRIPPPITRTPLPNLPGIRGTSLAATQPVISKSLRSTPLGKNSPREHLRDISQTGNSGPILHSVSSILLKENESGNTLMRPIPQIRPCFNPFAGINHQLLSGFSFSHPPPSLPLPLPPLTLFASPIRVIHPNVPAHGIPIPQFPSSPFPSSVGLRGTLPKTLSPLCLIPPPFAPSVESRRIVRRRRHSATSRSSEPEDADPESQKVRRRTANARERDRVTQLNSGFEQLRHVLPWEQQGRRTSKVDTLRAAIAYIDHLQRVLWDADHAGYFGSPLGVGSGLTTDICKFVDFRPSYGILSSPPGSAMCIGAAERRELERGRIAAAEEALFKGSASAQIGGTSHPNPTLRWLTEFQETLRRLPKPIEPSPRCLLREMNTRPRIVVVDSANRNNDIG